MKIKIAREDTVWDVKKPIYRKWWEVWKPKIIGTRVVKEVIYRKGEKYIDAEGKTVSELYDQINNNLRQETNAT